MKYQIIGDLSPYYLEKIKAHFWARVDRWSPYEYDFRDDCWLWTGQLRKNPKKRYGRFRVGNKTVHAHRLAYELLIGPIPEGELVCHHCDNPSCVNPAHLYAGTHQDNMNDMVARRRSCCDAGHSKLTEKQVLKIREKYIPYVYGTRRLAKEFGAAQTTIMEIVKRQTWKHI